MTVVRLGRFVAERHAVVAQRPVQGAPFVRHVGLLAEGAELVAGEECTVLQSNPPIEVAPPGRMVAHLVGQLDLTRDEVEIIETWLSDIQQLILPIKRDNVFQTLRHYVLVPPARLMPDEVNGRPKHWRFSCSGFVWKTYEHAGIKLVALEGLAVSREALIATYGAEEIAVTERLSAAFHLGLDGPPPWPVLMAGHVLHAIELGREELPLAATEQHATFE